jgi:serine phosphatase RsbU (regulator of sigma subunit)
MEDRVEALLSSAPMGMAFFDAELRLERVNQPFLELLEGPASDAEGQMLDAVPGMPPQLARAVRRAFESGLPVDEAELIVPESGPLGTRRHYLARAFPVIARGVVRGAGATLVDITDRRRGEAAIGLVLAASDLFASSPDFDEMLDRVIRLGIPLFADAVALYLPDSGTDLPKWSWAASDPAGAVHTGSGRKCPPELDAGASVHAALATRRTQRVADVGVGESTGGPLSVIAAPLITAGQTLGVLVFANTHSGRRYLPEHDSLADELGRRCADAIHNAHLTRAELQARDRLELLARVGELMTVELDSQARLDGTTRLAVPHFADFSVVYLKQRDGSARLASFAHKDPAYDAMFAALPDWPALEPGSAAPPMRAIVENQPVLVTDVGGHDLKPFLDDDAKREAAERIEVRSMLAVPLPTPDGPLGSLAFAYTHRNYVPDDVALAREIARRVAPAVENALRFEFEHATAETLQRSLLPERIDDSDSLELVARYRPAALGAKIGGDWYDVVTLGEGRTLVVIGDVLGHGLRAAAWMSRLRTAFHVYALDGLSGAEILERLNTYMVTEAGSEPTMASMLVADHDATTNRVRFANAGHLPPCLRRGPGDAELLSVAPGTPVGAVEGATYEHTDATIPPGATLLLYTDGLIERRQEALDKGFERLCSAVATGPVNLVDLVDAVVAALLGTDDHEDDVALIAMRPRST